MFSRPRRVANPKWPRFSKANYSFVRQSSYPWVARPPNSILWTLLESTDNFRHVSTHCSGINCAHAQMMSLLQLHSKSSSSHLSRCCFCVVLIYRRRHDDGTLQSYKQDRQTCREAPGYSDGLMFRVSSLVLDHKSASITFTLLSCITNTIWEEPPFGAYGRSCSPVQPLSFPDLIEKRCDRKAPRLCRSS